MEFDKDQKGMLKVAMEFDEVEGQFALGDKIV
jgi:hypothetical protein